ncbi:MAG: glycosyltransferase family 1 protein [Dysgonamonadaceae bacterium]|nr:glycosyltransferase family 1 protein [Dysgonamonadaceae bacterium]MDD3728168.1 glycosyltransferase family 1 protein [Dysgonamonadaceae bacterium]
MLIGFDAKRAFHNSRGLGNYSRHTIRILSKYYPDNHYFLFNPKTKRKLSLHMAENMSEVNPQQLFWRTFPYLWRSLGMRQKISKRKLDIYHGLNQELPYGIQYTKAKTVVTLHDAIFVRYPKLYPPIYRLVFIAKNKHACKVADKIICISEQTKQDAIKFFGADENKIEVVYQGCDAIFNEEVSEKAKQTLQLKYNLPETYLLNVGTIEKRKNTKLIVEALHRTKNETPLLIVGKPTKYEKELRTLIAKYGMQEQVTILNNIETSDFPALYAMAKMFIFPSIFEGFGIPILEALTVGTPVITSAGSCFEETAGPFSLYFDSSDADQLGALINQVLSNDELSARMIAEGKKHALNFSDENIAANLMGVYRSLGFVPISNYSNNTLRGDFETTK